MLPGTEEHVRLADRAVRELAAGHPVDTHELVVSLRAFVRDALDLDPIPADLTIALQRPTRPASAGGGRGGSNKDDAGRSDGGSVGGGMTSGGRLGGGGMVNDAPSDDPHQVPAQNAEE